jgi:outer membrane protein
MKRVLIVSAVVMICLSGNAVRAQEAPPVKMNFKEAVNIGLKNNVALKRQKNQLEYTQINKTSSMLQLGPTVQAQGNAGRVDGNSFNNQTGEVVNGVVDYINGSIDASMPVFAGLGTLNTYRSAKSQNDAQMHFVHRTSQDVIQLVSSQFLTCILDMQLIKIYEENVRTQQIQYEQIKAQVEVGSKAESDLYNQEYLVKNAELTLLRARNTLMNDKTTLALTLQVDPSQGFDLDSVTWNVDEVLMDSLNLTDLQNTAINRRSDLKMAEENENAAHYSYSATKGIYYPSLYAGVSYGSRYNYIQGSENRTFNEQFTKDNTQLSYGLTLTIPIYNGLRSRSQAAFSRVSYENAKITKQNTEVTIKSDVIRSYQNFNDARTAYQVAAAQVHAAQLSYQTEKERYDLGMSDIVQLITVNQAYVAARGAFQNAKYTMMFQKIMIDYAVGTLKFEDIP